MLMAGSAEANLLAEVLVSLPITTRSVMSETPRGLRAPAIEPEVKQFSDVDEMVGYLAKAGSDAVLDASHGFDGTMTSLGFLAAKKLGLPFLRIDRPGWPLAEIPRGRSAVDVAAAMSLIAPGTRVFSATGWESLSQYKGFPGETLLLRQTRQEDRAPPFSFVEPVFGIPPFTVDSEVQLFEGMGVDLLICRNLGGRASRPKVDAAIKLGLDIILIDRPVSPPDMLSVDSVRAALDWVGAL